MSTTKQMRKYNGILRPYQLDGVADVRKSLAVGPTLLVSPTGAGKTDMAAVIAEGYRSVLFVAHRRELLSQAAVPMGAHVVRMSIQSALRYGPKETQCLIIDEAHRSRANTYQLLIEKYATATRLGLTATPLRTDGQGLCDAFSQLVRVSSMKELVASGHLVPYIPFGPSDEALAHLARLKTMKKRRGEFDLSALAELVNTPRLVGQVVSEYQEKARDRRAIVFGVNVEHSMALEKVFLQRNIRAVHIDGRASLKDRDAALAKVASGEIEVLCNVNLFTEGWDCPAISCVIMARPTASLTLYLQCVGRGMRPDLSSGKSDLLILDHAGNMARHGMPDEDREWSLETREQRERREREIAELKRIYALGFESLEQYRLERQRLDETTYTGRQVTRIFNCTDGSISLFLRSFGIKTINGKKENGRYPKQPVDMLRAQLDQTYSREECNRKLVGITGVKQISLGNWLRRHGTQPQMKRGNFYRFLKSDIDNIAETYTNTYSKNECASLLSIFSKDDITRYLSHYGIYPIKFGHRHVRFQRAEIDKFYRAEQDRVKSGQNVLSPTEYISTLEAAKLYSLSRSRIWGLAKQHDIKPIRPNRAAQTTPAYYPRVELDKVIRRHNEHLRQGKRFADS